MVRGHVLGEEEDSDADEDGHHIMQHPSQKKRPATAPAPGAGTASSPLGSPSRFGKGSRGVKAAPASVDPPAASSEDASPTSPGGAALAQDPVFQALVANLPRMDEMMSPGSASEDGYSEDGFESVGGDSMQSVVEEEIDEHLGSTGFDSFVGTPPGAKLSSPGVAPSERSSVSLGSSAAHEYERDYVTDQSIGGVSRTEGVDWEGVDKGGLGKPAAQTAAEMADARRRAAGGGA